MKNEMLSNLGRNGSKIIGRVKPDVNQNPSLPTIGDLQRTRRFVMKQQTTCVEDSRLRPSGMTGLFYHGNNAFTLIELLVVVLIIGILAAVAVPQYQKAVEKSRASEAFVWLKALRQVQEAYILTGGTATLQLDELAIDIPGSVTHSRKRQVNPYIEVGLGPAGDPHAWRKDRNGNILYVLAYYFPSQGFYCYAQNDQYIWLCKSLGEDAGDTCTGANDGKCFRIK